MNEHNPDLTIDLRNDMSPAEKRAYIQKWISRNQRRIASGLGASVLTLPLLAQAQTAMGMVNALDIAGVRSVALNADGSAQLTLANGQQVQVAASAVQVAADGTLLISTAAAELVAELVASGAASGAAGAGAGAGFGGAGAAAAVAGLGLAAAAAGGSSSSDSAPELPVFNASAFTNASPVTATSIFGSFPTLQEGDQVFIKFGDDGPEVEVTIDANGNIIFPDDLDLTDVQGNQTLRFQVKRTSLVEVENEDEDAEPVFEEVTEVVASGSASVIIDTIPPEITIDTPIAGDDVLNKAESGADLTIEGTAKGAEDGQEVTVTFNDQTFTAIVEGEAWSLTIPAADLAALDLDDGESYDITAAVSDKAGNPAEPATTTLATDFSAEITINPVVIETLNTFTGVTVTGTTTDVEAGREVTLSFNGVEYKTEVEEDGSWSVDILADVIKALDDEAEIAISATVSDVAGNADSAATSSTTDFSVPALVITSPESGGFINATTVGNPFDVSGVALAGAPVTVTLGTGETALTQTITADENNAWTVRFDNVGTLADGVLPITATTTIEGTPITAPLVTVELDTTPPGLTLTSSVNASNALVLSGTTDTDVEQVQLQVAGQSFTADAAGGTWSLTIPALDLPPVAAGADATILANATDRAGNSAPQQTLGLAAASVTIQTPLDGTIVGLEAFENGATFSGTTTGVAEGAQVRITLTSAEDPDGLTISAVVDAAGEWSVAVPAASVQNAVDQSDYTVTASVSGSAYPAIASDEIGVSTNIPPRITLDALGEDGALILSDGNSLDVSGSTRGVQAGQTVRILDSTDTELGTAQVGADGTWNTTVQVTNLSGGQVLDVKAVVTNASGRSVNDTGSVLGYEASLGFVLDAGVGTGGELLFNLFVDPQRIEGDIFRIISVGVEFDANILQPDLSQFSTPVFFDQAAQALNFFNITAFDGVANSGTTGQFSFNGLSVEGFNNTATTPVLRMGFSQQSEGIVEISLGRIGDENLIISTDMTESGGTGERYSETFGAIVHYFGTNGDDTITAANIDTVIRGLGGDDTIDVSAPGVNTIIFEPNFAANGEDTIIGFSTSGALADRIAIADLENGTLRGDGTQFELLDAGDAAGANTGLIVFKTSLDTDEDGIAALDSLGLGADDIVYIIVGDDADSELVRIVVNSDGSFPDLDDIEVLALFEGMGEEQRAEFGAANFINFDPVPSAPLVAILSEV